MSVLIRGHDERRLMEALRRLSRAYLEQSADPDPNLATGSLATGSVGIALANAALADVFPSEPHELRAGSALVQAVEQAALHPLPPSLYEGFVGIGWAIELLRGDPTAADEDDPNVVIDAALEPYLGRGPWREPFDLIGGLVGVGVYALERLPRLSARRLLSLILDRLEECADRPEGRWAWPTRPEWTPREHRETELPSYNLGLAHGAPGVIALLAAIIDADVELESRARPLLDGAIGWLLDQRLQPGEVGACPSRVGVGMRRTPARLAWCYGDVGVAMALLLASRAAGESAWEAEAMRLALGAAARAPSTAGVSDPGFCHGAAGVAHIFHRLHRATGDDRLAVAARFWLARLLDMGGDHKGFGGFVAEWPDGEAGLAARSDPGFLVGSAGITLTLAAMISEAEPIWDRALLLSTRRRAAPRVRSPTG